jgi:hypothetical protein
LLQFLATAVDASTARAVGRISFMLEIDVWIERLRRIIDNKKHRAFLIHLLANRPNRWQPFTCASCAHNHGTEIDAVSQITAPYGSFQVLILQCFIVHDFFLFRMCGYLN